MAKVILTSKSSAMKSILPLLALAVAFGSCTTAYKSGQTPDDVYYSPQRAGDDYVRTEERREERRYRDVEDYRDDRYLRMTVRNRRYVGLYDDYYSYNPYYYHYYNGSLFYNSPWTPVSYWNNQFNPYCYQPIFITPRRTVYSKPRTFDLSVYGGGNNTASNNPYKGGRTFGTYGSGSGSSSNGSYNPPRTTRSTSSGGRLRDVFGTGGSSSSGTSTKGSSSGSSSSGSSSGRSSGSSNAGARRF